jgi:Flp pilus assembly protein TadD
VIDHDKTNAYAANGLGIVLTSLGKVNEAKEVFTEVSRV